MKPLDPRLLRYARSSRRFLVLGAVLGLVQTLAMIVFAWFVAVAVTGAIAGRDAGELAGALWAMVGAVAVRAACQWATEAAGARAAAAAKTELRAELLRAVAALGPRRLGGSTAEVTTLATHGLEALDPYFGKYLPQLLMTMLATPVLIAVTWWFDPVSAITEVLTLPVIPLFMVIIGLATRRVQQQQLDGLTRLAGAFLEIVEGLSTLKIFGRARRQRDRIAGITDDYRRSTMKVLRLSFLSGFALELFASLSVALVAVQIGIRLIDDAMTLQVGLFALVLAPEVFAPIRQVGAQFHAAAEGVTASQRVFELIERAEASTPGGASVPRGASGAEGAQRTPGASGLAVRGVRVAYDDRPVLDGLDADFPRGAITAIAGESGAGKSTLLAFIRGELDGDGARELDGAPLDAPRAAAAIAWMGQRAGLLQGTVAENVALGRPDLDEAAVREALELAGIGWLDPALELGVGGDGLSGGQAQRVSLARTIARARALDTPIVLLDEPTSALDSGHEATAIAAMRALADEGRAVVVVSHRPAVVDAADRVVELRALAPAGAEGRDADRDAAGEPGEERR
ncbi:MAG: thiol reductant ABC exporter subunit CydD [Microbacteriaceae bacterium]|nr:thiol reductant ABC exporter subunit CydD [Microbacteriaceae bacterium]